MGVYDNSTAGRGRVILDPIDGRSAIGSLYGHRLWRMDDEGWLTGDYVRAKWAPGVNEARCYQTSIAMSGQRPAFQEGSKGPAYDFSTFEPAILEGWEPAACPGVAVGDHGCGFYVRTGNRYNSNFAHVRGVVEAWGDVEFGYQGFRATRARIVALLKPTVDAKARVEIQVRKAEMRYLKKQISKLAQTLYGRADIDHMERYEQRLETTRKINERMMRPAHMWPQIVERYPDALVFDDEAEMLAWWPPTDLSRLLGEGL